MARGSVVGLPEASLPQYSGTDWPRLARALRLPKDENAMQMSRARALPSERGTAKPKGLLPMMFFVDPGAAMQAPCC
jgi:hypothetical protein